MLSGLIKIVGPERLLLGSDWPIGEADPVGFVNQCPIIADEQKRMISGGRALELIAVER